MSRSTPPKMSYSTALARNTKLPIKEISIEQWLKHYGLEAFYTTIFTTNKSYITELGIPYLPYTAELLNSIKTNVHLLFSFSNHIHFTETITPYVELISSKMYQENKITKEHLDSAFYLKELINYFKLLKSQELEYKADFSLAGLNPTKEHYEKTVVNSKLLNFLDHNSFDPSYKSFIKDTLRMLDFDDFLHSTAPLFKLLISIHHELLQKFDLHTTHKIENIKNGAKKTMTNAEFKAFINGNKVIEYFESRDNIFDVKTIKRNLQEKFDAKSFIEAHRIELISSLIQPRTLVSESISDQIYNTIFPNSDNVYINKQFKLIDDNIPSTTRTLKLVKENKVRVFFIQGHGTSCDVKHYSSQPRVDFDSVFKQIGRLYKTKPSIDKSEISARPDGKYYSSVYDGQDSSRNIYKFENCMVASAQPLGRLSILKYINTFIDLFSFKYRDLFIRGLLDAVPNADGYRLQFYILDKIFTMLYYFNLLREKEGERNVLVELEKEFNKFLETYKFDEHSHGKLQYPDTVFTSRNLINLIKYDHNYPPVNSTYSFKHHSSVKEDMYGIFELDPNHSSDLKDLNMHVKDHHKGTADMKMGLELEHLYKFRGDVPLNIDAILKYNREIKRLNKYDNCSLSDIIEIIYAVGNIKSDEFVLVISNSCRGLHDEKELTNASQEKFNTSENFSRATQHKIASLRIASIEGSSRVQPSEPSTVKLNAFGKRKKRRSSTKRSSSTKRRRITKRKRSTKRKRKRKRLKSQL